MSLVSRISRSWRLIKASAAVLNSDGELIFLPIASGVVALLLGGGMIALTASTGIFETLQDGSTGSSLPAWFYVWLFGFYLVQYTVITFFNVALVGAAIERLEGGDPTVRSGLAIAMQRLPQILGFALMQATVGMVLRAIAERGGFIGKLIAGGLGFAWAVTTFLVVPVIAVEASGPVVALKRSAALLRKTWGENILGNAGIGLLLGVAGSLLALIGVGGVALVATGNDIVGIPIAGAAFLAFGALIAVGSALAGVYAAAVYRYAVSGEPPAGFDRDMVQSAFTQKPAN